MKNEISPKTRIILATIALAWIPLSCMFVPKHSGDFTLDNCSFSWDNGTHWFDVTPLITNANNCAKTARMLHANMININQKPVP